MASVQTDERKMQGTAKVTAKGAYDMHEIQSPDGGVLREFTSPSGNVFGVAWQGHSHPDLRQVLGSYYDQYVQAVQKQRAERHGHGPLLIQEPGLVMHMGGHMRSLHGRAYIPQNLPSGVRAEDIQ
jgi:hypothetical protein